MIPPHIAQAAEDAAEKYFYQWRNPNGIAPLLPGVMSIDEHFKSGVHWLFTHLSEQAEGEFDDDAFNKWIFETFPRDKGYDNIHYMNFFDVARHQHALSSALIAGLREEIERLEDLLEAVHGTTLEQDTKSRIANNMRGTPLPIKRNSSLQAKLIRMTEALKYYASDDAWTIDQVEGSYGDYGSKARAALAETERG